MINTTCNSSHSNQIYQIILKGHLGPEWKDWFEGLSITQEANGTSVLMGPVVDQAALFGHLRKIRDLGIPLISVIRLQSKKATPSNDHK